MNEDYPVLSCSKLEYRIAKHDTILELLSGTRVGGVISLLLSAMARRSFQHQSRRKKMNDRWPTPQNNNLYAFDELFDELFDGTLML